MKGYGSGKTIKIISKLNDFSSRKKHVKSKINKIKYFMNTTDKKRNKILNRKIKRNNEENSEKISEEKENNMRQENTNPNNIKFSDDLINDSSFSLYVKDMKFIVFKSIDNIIYK